MKFCLLDSTNNVCVNIVELNSAQDFISYDNLILAPDHSGGIGWTWTENGWYNPRAVVYTQEQKAERARKKRNMLLKKYVDSINPMKWESLSEEQKTAWTTFRRALLDIPQQEGFPNTIVWPEKPSQ